MLHFVTDNYSGRCNKTYMLDSLFPNKLFECRKSGIISTRPLALDFYWPASSVQQCHRFVSAPLPSFLNICMQLLTIVGQLFSFFELSNLVIYHNQYMDCTETLYTCRTTFFKSSICCLLPCNEMTRMESKFMSSHSITYCLWSFGSIFLFFSSRPMRRQKKLKSSLPAVPSRTLQGRWSRASRGFTLMQTGFRAFKKRRISPRQWRS